MSGTASLVFDFTNFSFYRLYRSWPARDDPLDSPWAWGPFNQQRANSILDANGDGLNDIVLFFGYFDTGPHIPPIFLLNDGHGGWTQQTISLPGFLPENVDGDWAFSWKGSQYLIAVDSGYERPGDFEGSRIWLLKYDSTTKSFEDDSNLIPGNVNNFNHKPWFGDVDGNGKLDVIVAALGGSKLPGYGVRWFEFGETVTDRTSELPPAIAYATYANGAATSNHVIAGGVGVGDLNGDGFNDLVVVSYIRDTFAGGDPSIRILFGSSQGFSQPPLVIDAPNYVKITPYTAGDPTSGPMGGIQALVVDVNGDTKNDLIVIWESGSGDYVQILLNQGGQLIDRTSELLGTLGIRNQPQLDPEGNIIFAFQQVQVVDFDHNGSPDLYLRQTSVSASGLISGQPEQAFLWQNDGTGHFTAANLVPASERDAITSIENVTAWENYFIGYPMYGDVTGDGVADLVTLTAIHDSTTTIAGSLYSNYVDLVTIPGIFSTAVSIVPVSATKAEGNVDSTPLTFSVMLQVAAPSVQSVHWSVSGAGANAANGGDFAGGILPSGIVIFNPGEASKTLTIDIAGDTLGEPDKTFLVVLSAPTTGLTIGSSSALGTILNDDTSVAIAAASASLSEGNSGTTIFTFTATLTGDSSVAHSVSYAVAGSGNNPANAADFQGGVLPAGVVTFAAGETTKTIAIQIAGDIAVEIDEGFVVSLSNPSIGLTISTASANGTILNDDKVAIAHDDAYIVLKGQALTIGSTIGVLANDDNASTATLAGGPSHGSLQLAANGGFTYGATAGFASIDSFTYHSANGGSSADGHALLYVIPTLTGGASTTLDLLGLTAEEQIAATYIAFFGRGADTSGFHFWVGQFQANIAQGGATLFANIASSFGVSDEARGLYPFLANPFGASDPQIGAFIDSVYLNMFNRGPDAAGLAYWTAQTKATLAAGQFVGSILVNIMSGAQNTADGQDITTLMGKVAVSLDFVAQQDLHGAHWNGAADTAAATSLLQGITSDPGTVLAGIKNADALIAGHA